MFLTTWHVSVSSSGNGELQVCCHDDHCVIWWCDVDVSAVSFVTMAVVLVAVAVGISTGVSVYVFVIVPRRLTSWLMILLWYSIGTVTSTSMIGSRI